MPQCPVDRIDMRAIALPGGASEYLCLRCEGLWLPGRVVQASIGATALERIRDAGGTRRELRCPHDGHPLQALHHHGVEIDACPHCAGVWLDAGERDRILQARNQPGITRRIADAGADAGNTIDLIEVAGDIGGAVLEFIGEALSGL